MKKQALFITLLTLLFTLIGSCEKDDICIEEITPLLIIRFYDNADPEELKSVSYLKVQIEGVSGDFSNETITILTDSIAIPIKVTDDITKFKLILNGADADLETDNEDVFDLSYIREDVFVSRSCGYKTIYFDATSTLITDSENWIKSIKTIDEPQDILNQNSAHVKIYH